MVYSLVLSVEQRFDIVVWYRAPILVVYSLVQSAELWLNIMESAT